MGLSLSSSIISEFSDNLDSNLKIKLEEVLHIPRCVIIHPIGQIDTYNSSKFQAGVSTLIASGYYNIVLDFSSVSYMSSTGIGSLTFIMKALSSKSGRMIIYGIQPKIYEVMNLLGFTTFFETRNSREEALFSITSNTKQESVHPSIFPKLFACPKCKTKLKAPHAGKFKCSKCKALIVVDSRGSSVAL